MTRLIVGSEGTLGVVTELIVRATGARGYRTFGLPPAVSIPVARLMHFIMERRQLLGIARRAEAMAAAWAD